MMTVQSKVPIQAEASAWQAGHVRWPNRKRFAFTIFDDTDGSTTENISPIYRLLTELGFRTTKSVWPLKCSIPSQTPSSTCADPDYVAFVRQLRSAGFEIGLHNASWNTSTRCEVEAALNRFKQVFDAYPTTLAQHGNCNENIYWAAARVSGIRQLIYRAFRNHAGYYPQGHLEGSPFFWGDLCQKNIKYVRNFVFRDINTLKACPEMPYHDPKRPYVRYWFASSDGSGPAAFARLLSPANQDRLEEEGGACIVYTHFYNFSPQGTVLPEIEQLLRRLAKKEGWFVPVNTLLDFLFASRPEAALTDSQRRRLEWHWLHDVIFAHADDFVRRQQRPELVAR